MTQFYLLRAGAAMAWRQMIRQSGFHGALVQGRLHLSSLAGCQSRGAMA